ncbi:MAG: LVIVD repeat-containing protein [Terriglobia bacterium]
MRLSTLVTLAFLLCALFALSLSQIPVSRGASAGGAVAGDGADDDLTSFKFRENNAEVELTKTNGVPIALDEVSALYGTPDGMRIYVDGVDIADPAYAGPGGRKQPVGANLSDATGWPRVDVSPGQVAIDPNLGRFKFYERRLAGQYDTGVALDVFVRDNYAFVADGGDLGFQIVDVSTPVAPKLTSTYTTKTAVGLTVSGNYAYVASAVGLQILDVSEPAKPKLVGKHSGGNSFRVAVQGPFAYLTTLEGLQIINVSNPQAPSLAGTFTVDATTSDVFVRGNQAFLAGSSGLQIVNVSDPANPSLDGQLPIDLATGVFVSGNYAYLAVGEVGLRVVSIANPAALAVVGSFDTPGGNAAKVFVESGRAYVADGEEGLKILDVSNPAAPTLLRSFDTPGSAMGSFARGDQAYVADHASGLQVIDLSAPPSETPNGRVTVDFHFKDIKQSELKAKTEASTEEGRITDFIAPRLHTGNPAVFKVVFENTGEVPVKPTGAVRVASRYGKGASVKLKSRIVPAGKTRTLTARWNDPPMIGSFRAQARVSFGVTNRTAESDRSSFYIFPWRAVIVVGGIFALIFFFERRYRSQKPPGESTETPSEQPPD